MSCPYFFPTAPRMPDAQPHDAMLPLGASWTGLCHAGGSQQPADALLRPCCNLGYARGTCSQFPTDNGPDAVRFNIARDDGDSLRVAYVVERDHHPFANGSLEYSRSRAAFDHPPAGDILARQALAYVEIYRRRKDEAFPLPITSNYR